MQLPAWFSDVLDVWESGLRLMQLQIESKKIKSGFVNSIFQRLNNMRNMVPNNSTKIYLVVSQN